MRWRLVAVFVGITFVVLLVHDLPLANHLRHVERDSIQTALERDAFTIAGRAEEALEAGDALADPQLQAMVDEYREEHGARVIVADGSGTAMVISDEEARAGTDYSSRPEIAAALSGTPVSGVRHSDTLDQDLLYVAVPVFSGSEVHGAVRLTFPEAVVSERVERRVRGLLVVALISLATAAVAAVVLAGTVSGPLRRVRAATEQAAQGDLSVRAPTHQGPPEVRSLATSFNTMSERLEGLIEEQRGFAGDASRQLRTPLTALHLRLEQAAALTSTDPAAARQRIEAAGAEAERLQHLVEGLLVLARVEGQPLAGEPVDVSAVVRERADVWTPLAEEQGVAVVVDVAPGLHGLAVPGAIEQIVDNLVDNAVSVAPAGSTLTIRAERVAGSIGIHVLDEGPGMSDDQLSRAFDRFWRAPDAAVGGSGLGLAIVHQLARVSGGTASLTRRPGGGLDAQVTVPASSSRPAGQQHA